MELHPGIGCSKAPVHPAFFIIVIALPCRHLSFDGLEVGNAGVRALAAKNAQLSFGHIQPAAMLGCVAKVQATQNALGLFRAEGPVEGGGGMGVEIILHDQVLVSLSIVPIHQGLEEISIIQGGALLGDGDPPPSTIQSLRFVVVELPSRLVARVADCFFKHLADAFMTQGLDIL